MFAISYSSFFSPLSIFHFLFSIYYAYLCKRITIASNDYKIKRKYKQGRYFT